MGISEAQRASLGPLDALPLPAVAVDALGDVLAANGAAEALLATEAGHLRGEPLAHFVVEESRAELERVLRARSTEPSAQIVLRSVDGALTPVELFVAPDGDYLVAVLVARPPALVRRERARDLDAQLDRARGGSPTDAYTAGSDVLRVRLGRLLEEIDQGLLAIDAELWVRFANEAALEMLAGIRLDAKLPACWRGFDIATFAASLFESSAVSAEATVKVGKRQIRLGGVPAADELALVFVTDVTARVQQEEAERDFVANAAHELLNPIAAIMSAADALELASGDQRQRQRFLEHIVRESRRLDRLLRALLDLARAQHRGQPPTLEPVALRRLLTGIADGLRPGADVQVSVVCPASLVVATNADLLEQAVANLAANAVRHTKAGEVRLSALAARSRVVIDVDDTGPGIPPELRRLVVERFYRAAHGGGAGLGLAIARQAIEGVSGRLELLDSPLGGTRARIVLPDVEAA